MVWHSTPDQILIQDREFKTTNKKRRIKDPTYDLSRTNKEDIDVQNDVSKHSRTLCYICKRNDKIVTDPESGETICSNCGMVISDKVEDTSHLERHIFRGGQIDETRARTGAPSSLARHDMGLATIIGK